MNFLCPACRTPLPAATPVVVACTQCGVEVDLTRVDTAPGQAKLWPEVDLAGESLGTFKLVSRAGSGGMGTVYVAEGLTGRCAVKVLSPQLAADPSLRERFRREAQALRKVTHPGVVHIIDEGSQNGFCWYAMEHVDGKDLRARIADGPMPAADVEALARQLLDALAAVHEAQLVHRDIKPGNILLSPAGARLCDFGIARFDGATTLTESAALLGSLRYMAPEQRAGITTPKSDLYSLGLVLHEAATGGLPGDKDMPSGRVGRLIEALLQASPQKRPADARAAAKMVALKPKRTVGTAVAAAAATVGMAIFATWAIIATQFEPNTTATGKKTAPIAEALVDAGPPVVAGAAVPDAGAVAAAERIPRVRAAPFSFNGFDEAAVRELVATRQSDLLRCYETALRDAPQLEGRIDVRVGARALGVKGRGVPLLRPLVLRGAPPKEDSPPPPPPEGKRAIPLGPKKKSVKGTPVELDPAPAVTLTDSNLANPELERCILEAIRGWPFPSPRTQFDSMRLAWMFEQPTRDELAAEAARPSPEPPPRLDTGGLEVLRGTGTKLAKPKAKPLPTKAPEKMAPAPPDESAGAESTQIPTKEPAPTTVAAKTEPAPEPDPKGVKRVDRVAPVMAQISKLRSQMKKGDLTTEEATGKMLDVIDVAVGEIGEPIDDYEMVQRAKLLALKKKIAPPAPKEKK